MKINKQFSALLLASGLVVGGLAGGVLMAPTAGVANAAPIAQTQPPVQTPPTAVEADQTQDPSLAGSIAINPTTPDGLSEIDETTALQAEATLTPAQAEAAALAANPNATVVKTQLDDENGYLVYSVELNSGSDVKVDAGNGAILATDQSAGDAEMADGNGVESKATGDTDNVQEEHDSQVDDATEAPSVEDAQ